MRLDILSLFPEYFTSPLDVSILKKARDKKLIDIRLIDIRDFTKDKHRTVDDRPYGGGPGMVLLAEPVRDAILHVKTEKSTVIYMSARGERLEAKMCEDFARLEHVILLCGHYEGIDQRVIDKYVDREISVGDYVLTSGCPAALVFIDAVARFIPEVLGNPESSQQDSFQKGFLEAPHYTRPQVFENMEVPEVLLQGNHAEIAKWRQKEGLNKTRQIFREKK